MYGFLVVPFQSVREEMCNWSEKCMWDASNVQRVYYVLG
jgi:hypothetical protein